MALPYPGAPATGSSSSPSTPVTPSPSSLPSALALICTPLRAWPVLMSTAQASSFCGAHLHTSARSVTVNTATRCSSSFSTAAT